VLVAGTLRDVTTIELSNTTPFLQVLNLPSADVPEMARFSVVGVTAGAERKVVAKRLAIGGSITLQPAGFPGSKQGGLPLSVLDAKDVKDAKNAGRVSVRHCVDAEAEEKAAQEAAQKAKEQADATAAAAAVRRGKRDKLAGADVGSGEK
jgi:hypothetical protein